MGAFDTVRDIVIPDPDNPTEAKAFRDKWRWDPHEQVTLRGRATAGDQEEMANASTKIDEHNNPVILAGTGRTIMLLRMIVRWTLTQNGHPVDVNLENVRELPSRYSVPLLEVCDRLVTGMSEEAQRRFLASANGHTPENSGVAKESLKPF